MKKAFTLAEVLITLGIIGVVAALTIPNLIMSYKIHVQMTQLKKTYSIILQAQEMAKADHGDVKNWNWQLDEVDFLNTYIKPYLNIAQDCGLVSSKKSKCWGASTPNNVNLYGMNNSAQNAGNWYSFKLKSGENFSIAYSPGNVNINPFAQLKMRFDVDGDKGQTRWGYDVYEYGFYFQDGYTGMYKITLPRSSMLTNCSINTHGDVCGALYQQDGWQILDDVKASRIF